MINYKNEISKIISESINGVKILPEYIEIPKYANNGDFAFPCFRLAKELKKSPIAIAEEIKQNIKLDNNLIEKMDVVGGYLNFYTNKENFAKEVLEEVNAKQENYGSSKIGENKNIVIDYSSPNIAKPFHIGHLRTTILGNSLYKMYKFLNYNCVGINHLGDWGTQFAKLIEGYKRWGTEYDIESNPIEELTKIYIRINDLCKEDESVLEQCRWRRVLCKDMAKI